MLAVQEAFFKLYWIVIDIVPFLELLVSRAKKEREEHRKNSHHFYTVESHSELCCILYLPIQKSFHWSRQLF